MVFVVPGMIAYSAMFAASFETTIGSFSRYYLHRNWDAVLSTPVSLVELMLGEVLWAACKAMISAICVLVVGWAWGGVNALGSIIYCLPFIFLSCLGFASVGLLATAYAKGYEFFSYFFTFWVTPMFVFCGVFFETNRFPEFIQLFAWLLPMTHVIKVIRPLTAGGSVSFEILIGHVAYLLFIFLVSFLLAYRKIGRKLFD